MAGVRLDGVTKRFGSTVAVHELDLEIDDREFLVLLGPSGCGKSTVLRMIAGLEEPTAGVVSIGGRPVNGVDPRDRDIAMVFQSYALYPTKTARDNIAYPLKARKVPKPEREQRVLEVAAALGLTDLLDRKPGQMSGGQRQRVALARAIVRRPAVFLMDEPLSNLDAKLRSQTRAELVDLHQRLGVTFVYVTHDQVEAMTMGDRIAVLDQGVLQQVGPPQEVYDRPASTFVAQFIGAPPMNLIPGTVEGACVRTPAGDLPLTAPAERGDVLVGVRPEHLRFDPDGSLEGSVRLVESLGHERHVRCRLAGGAEVIARTPEADALPHDGEPVRLTTEARHVHLFDPATGKRR